MDYPVKLASQLGPVVAGVRRSLKLTQTEVARRMGADQAAISDLERDASRASLERVLKLLSVLGCDLLIRGRRTGRTAKPDAG